MDNSLKELHERKQRIVAIDHNLSEANKRSKILVEALKQEDLEAASQIINKLRLMKGKGLKNLDTGIAQAESEINRYVGGGILTKALTKLKASVGIDNPLVKTMTFANALEVGFQQMPTILSNNIDLTNVDKNSSIQQLGLKKDQIETLTNTMRSALSPTGLFGIFKKVPYMDKEKLVADLLSVPIKTLETVVKISQTGPKTTQIANDMKDILKPGTAQTTKTTPEQPAQQTAATTATQTTQSPVAGTEPKTAEQGTPQPTKELNQKEIFDGIGRSNISKLITTIAQNAPEPGKAVTKILMQLQQMGKLKV